MISAHRRFLLRALGVLAVVVTTGATAHKFYFSRTVVRHNVQTNSLEVEMRIFTDDLERAIGATPENPARLGDEREIEEADRLIEEYLRENFSIAINGQPMLLRFWGKEVDYDITWCFFEVSNVPDIHVIEVKNTTLIDVFEDQLNEVDLEMAGWERRIQLHREQPSEAVQN